jgi:probable HAF family extracellular repeat protein
MKRSSLIGAATLLLAAEAVAWGAPASCRATDLGTLGGRASRAAGIGRDGSIVGSADRASGDTVAAVFRDGEIFPLGTLGGVASSGRDLFGQQVVGTSEVAPEVTHAFLWDGLRLRDLGALGEGRDATATGINRRGEIVGFSQIGRSNASPFHAFVVRRGRMTDLGAPGGSDSVAHDINDQGVIVGSYSRPDGGSVAFQNVRGRFFDLGHLGGRDAEARAINERGQIAGVSQTSHGQRHAFRWHVVLSDLGTLGGTRSTGLAINEAGSVVGSAETPDGSMHAFLAESGGSMVDLHALAAPAGVTLTEAVGIDDAGRIAANGRLDSGADHAFLLTGCD